LRIRLALFALALFTALSIFSQSAAPTKGDNELFNTVAALDKALFDAVNTCDIEKVASFWADDAEFYHDKTGLMTGGKKITQSIKENLCGKVQRELVPGTLEVYPVNGYGAVEIGVHRFLHPFEQDHGVVGEARFIHLWQLKDGRWKITRVISYDHGLAK
jgi:ketosteroid isomerase-like protein